MCHEKWLLIWPGLPSSLLLVTDILVKDTKKNISLFWSKYIKQDLEFSSHSPWFWFQVLQPWRKANIFFSEGKSMWKHKIAFIMWSHMFVVKYVYVHKQRYGKVYNKNFTWQSVGLYVSSKLYRCSLDRWTDKSREPYHQHSWSDTSVLGPG